MKKILLSIAAASVLFSGNVLAEEKQVVEKQVMELTKENVKEVNNISIPAKMASELVKQSINDFKLESGIITGILKKGKIFFDATSSVGVNDTDPQFGKYKALAYEEAMLLAQRKFVEFMYQTVESEVEKTLFENSSTNAKELNTTFKPETKTASLFDKIVALGNAKLNNRLSELEVDPEEFKAAPQSRQKEIFNSALRKITTTKTMGKISGVIPVQTFTGKNENGNRAVGVIIMYSDKLAQLAKDISLKRPTLITKDSGQPVSNFIPKTDDEKLNTMGIRVVFLENGNPAILSFGQFSHNYNGKNERKLERSREIAERKAEMLANSMITEFLNSKMSASATSEISSSVTENIVATEGEDLNEENFSENLIDIYSEQVKRKSSAKISGIGTINSWLVKTEQGQEILGVTKLWTYENMNSALELKGYKDSKSQSNLNHKTKVKLEEKPKGTNTSKSGKKLINLNDF